MNQHSTIAATSLPGAAKGASGRAFPRWIRWAFALCILVSCALFLDLGRIVATLRHVTLGWVVFILALWTVDRLLMAWKWSFLLRALKVRVPLAKLMSFYYQGSFAGTFLPSSLGGDVLRAYWVSRATGASHQVYASLIMEKTIGFLSAVNWALVGGLVFAWRVLPQVTLPWAAAAAAGILALYGLFVCSLQPGSALVMQRALRSLPSSRVVDFFSRLCESYSQYGQCRSGLFWNGILTVVEHGLQILIVFAMAKSLGITADSIAFLAVTAVYLLIYRLPLSPDGWGVGEVAAVGLFDLIGVRAESAFALAFLAHVLQTIVVLPGFWFLWRPNEYARRMQAQSPVLKERPLL